MKKERKEKKIKYPEVVPETKIRDVEINQKQHFLFFVAMIIVFNLILMFSVGYVLSHLSAWYNWVICFGLLFLSWGLSFKAYRDVKVFHRCELYNNALVMNSIWFNTVVDLKDICEIKVKESVLDKLFKINTKSLEIKIVANRRKKFTIHFIEEDAEKLKWEILKTIEDKPDVIIKKDK